MMNSTASSLDHTEELAEKMLKETWIVLDQSRIRTLVGQGEAASVAELVRVGREGKPGLVAIFADRKPGGAPVKWLALLAHEKRPAGRFHACAFGKPCLDDAQLVGG